MESQLFDVIVVGGGPVGLAAAYEVAKAGKKVLVLEQNNFFNQAGSSGDLARMFRTMYGSFYGVAREHQLTRPKGTRKNTWLASQKRRWAIGMLWRKTQVSRCAG